MKLGEQARTALIEAAGIQDLYVQGEIIKLIEDEDSPAFRSYLAKAEEREQEARKRRRDANDALTQKNQELLDAQKENTKLLTELQDALAKAKNAQQEAESNLDHLQKKTQFELMSNVVRTALWVITVAGVTTTVLYLVAMKVGKETTLIGNAWSNLLGILVTNSFSIIGTIMGVKYAASPAPGATTNMGAPPSAPLPPAPPLPPSPPSPPMPAAAPLPPSPPR